MDTVETFIWSHSHIQYDLPYSETFDKPSIEAILALSALESRTPATQADAATPRPPDMVWTSLWGVHVHSWMRYIWWSFPKCVNTSIRQWIYWILMRIPFVLQRIKCGHYNAESYNTYYIQAGHQYGNKKPYIKWSTTRKWLCYWSS